MDLVATHQRLLLGACLRTTGPILELGVGWYSTPLLHEIAEAQRRRVVTVDNNPDWLAQFLPMESDFHRLHHIGWWGYLTKLLREIYATRWAVCLVDQGQPIEREYAMRALFQDVDVFVCHDTEELFAYGYERTLPMFRYVYTDRAQKAWASVVSNMVDVTGWFTDLPVCEPSSEVT